MSYSVRAILNKLVPNSLIFHDATLIVDANGTAHEVQRYREGNILINVTAISGGAPSVTLVVETSDDGTVWYERHTFPAMTATGKAQVFLSNLGKHMRVRATVVDSITLTVKGDFKP